jgi:hypothetical protein
MGPLLPTLLVTNPGKLCVSPWDRSARQGEDGRAPHLDQDVRARGLCLDEHGDRVRPEEGVARRFGCSRIGQWELGHVPVLSRVHGKRSPVPGDGVLKAQVHADAHLDDTHQVIAARRLARGDAASDDGDVHGKSLGQGCAKVELAERHTDCQNHHDDHTEHNCQRPQEPIHDPLPKRNTVE